MEQESGKPHRKQTHEISEKFALQIISNVKEQFDCCYDKNGPLEQVGSESLWNIVAQLKYKGTKLRLITEITKENIAYCKTMMRYFDVRHLDGIKGNFGVLDKQEYLGNMLSTDENSSQPFIHIDNRPFVELQQYIFETLWNKAVPSKEKIKEIELGLDKEFLETIKDPLEIKNLIESLIKSATYEILILFSTTNSFTLVDKENILQVLKDSVNRGVNVRILVPTDSQLTKETSSSKEQGERKKQLYIQYLSKPLQTNLITMIVDQAISLSIEINNESGQKWDKSVGLATYTNTESKVSSNASIFESLWIQSELEKQNKIKQVYFQVFKGFGLKDEVYKRHWDIGDEKTSEI